MKHEELQLMLEVAWPLGGRGPSADDIAQMLASTGCDFFTVDPDYGPVPMSRPGEDLDRYVIRGTIPFDADHLIAELRSNPLVIGIWGEPKIEPFAF